MAVLLFIYGADPRLNAFGDRVLHHRKVEARTMPLQTTLSTLPTTFAAGKIPGFPTGRNNHISRHM